MGKRRKEPVKIEPFFHYYICHELYSQVVNKSHKRPIIFYQKHEELSTEKCVKIRKAAKFILRYFRFIHNGKGKILDTGGGLVYNFW